MSGPRRAGVLRIDASHLDQPSSIHESEAAATSPVLSTPPSAAVVVDGSLSLREATEAFQRRHIEQALDAHADDWAATARALGVNSANLHRLGKRLGLK